MDKYECLGTIGEGTYGVVLKCRHKVTGQIVAIKKFKESDNDEQVKKTALREIRILKQLKHENIVSLLEVFRMKDKLYLVFEFVEKTILEEIERHPEGLDSNTLKRLMWQLVRAITFCHQHNIIHRDIKPENLLVSRNGVLKLCDFGFARPLAGAGAKYTEYVSTRWYRAPELLVGDVSYGKAVDVWSIGCMFAEIATGLPLFPGDSDIDQLYHIMSCLGGITSRHHELFRKNELYMGVNLPQVHELEPLDLRFPTMDKVALDFVQRTIVDEPLDRWTCAELLQHPFFDNAHEAFERELHEAIARDVSDTAAVRKKRARQPSRGKLVVGSNSVLLVPSLPFSDVLSKVANAETSNSLGTCIKSNKEKNVSRKSPSGTETDAYHLPTLLSIGTSSSSLSLIANSTALAVNGMPFGDTGTSTGQISPLLHQNKKLTVPPRHLEATTFGLFVPMEHRTFIGVHDKGRGSITSHGGRLAGDRGIAVHPYTNPLSCMKSLYGVEQPLQRDNGKKSSVHAAVSSQLISKDMHTAKKPTKDGQYSFGHDTGWSGIKNGAASSSGGNLMPRATPPQLKLYAPLRTSYHPLRAPTILPNHCALVQRKK